MTYTVAVRALCEFTAKSGDLDLRFTPGPTAQEGIEGHAVVRSRRGSSYLAEVSLSGSYQHLQVRGRADGYDPALNQLEEIKTHRGSLAAMPANHQLLHWAQAKVYAHLMCQERDLSGIRVALVYYDIVDHKETVLVQDHTAAGLEAFFDDHCRRFLAWADQEQAHLHARGQALAAMAFPYPTYRRGQRELAVAVFKVARHERRLLAQAPTGIGKTVATLFPLLKACAGNTVDKVFFLTARTSGRRLAMDALKTLSGGENNQGHTLPLPRAGALRVLELTAREKACEFPELACHGDSCPLAKGFYDRLPAARQAAVQAATLDKQTLRAIALEHQVCPYWLGHDLAQWSDVIIGDYNYYFDGSALLYRLATDNQWRVGVLVDEAHNLVERARGMYSAVLTEAALMAVRHKSPAALKKPLDALSRAWRKSVRDQTVAYQTYDGIPAALQAALVRASGAMSDYMAEKSPYVVDAALQRLHFDIAHFVRLCDVFGSHSIFDVHQTIPPPQSPRARADTVLCIRNMVPAPFLQPRFQACHTATLFSATLRPWRFYRDMLGLPEDTAWIDVESPFEANQLQVTIVDTISTRYQHRAQSIAPIAHLMAEQFRDQPGNYLSYFSSFDYLNHVFAEFARRFPDIPVWAQSRNMNESAKEAFLDRFHTDGAGIGFAVLGGAFAEGIDLPGKRLIGAFVSTLGLPQFNPVNEQLRLCLANTFGTRHGYDYAYLYPGMQKVVQAAGRVIRSPSDRGAIFLIDDRFAQPRMRELMPHWWEVAVADRSNSTADETAVQPY
jgi:DNA excision repair protein ERCC-2